MKTFLVLVLALLLGGCVTVPNRIQPVDGFEVEKYLGKWYEIARLDHSFERDLIRVTAEYRRQEDGGVSVLNRGYSLRSNSWKETTGKAYFVGSADRGHLKVSFFGPFYGAYIVFELDRNGYQYAMVCGPNKSYLWILARTPQISAELLESLTMKAARLGFNTEKLIFVEQR